MKLELKHLAGYLPYGLKIRYIERNETHNLEYHNIISICSEQNHLKPILHPLSDLINHFEFVDKYHYSFDKKEGFMVKRRNETYARIYELDYLYKNHFDIYGLIENGLAIDINTLSK